MALGDMGLKPWEFEALGWSEFLIMVEGHNDRMKVSNTRLECEMNMAVLLRYIGSKIGTELSKSPVQPHDLAVFSFIEDKDGVSETDRHKERKKAIDVSKMGDRRKAFQEHLDRRKKKK